MTDDWIAMSDQPPPDDQPVLVKGTERVMDIDIPFEREAVYLDSMGGVGGSWYSVDGGSIFVPEGSITHWKPRP